MNMAKMGDVNWMPAKLTGYKFVNSRQDVSIKDKKGMILQPVAKYRLH